MVRTRRVSGSVHTRLTSHWRRRAEGPVRTTSGPAHTHTRHSRHTGAGGQRDLCGQSRGLTRGDLLGPRLCLSRPGTPGTLTGGSPHVPPPGGRSGSPPGSGDFWQCRPQCWGEWVWEDVLVTCRWRAPDGTLHTSTRRLNVFHPRTQTSVSQGEQQVGGAEESPSKPRKPET